MSRQTSISKFLKQYCGSPLISTAIQILNADAIVLTWYLHDLLHFVIHDDETKDPIEIDIQFEGNEIVCIPEIMTSEYLAACMLYQRLGHLPQEELEMGKIYTREGMIKRVLEERQERANKAQYRVKLGSYKYGPHLLIDEKNITYDVTIWDFEKKQGYISNIDWQTNKLATTKHIIFLVDYINHKTPPFRFRGQGSQFIEITLDPIRNYKLTWKHQGKLSEARKRILFSIFGNETHLDLNEVISKLDEIRRLESESDFLVRQEIFNKIEEYYDRTFLQKMSIELLAGQQDYSFINASLYPYQKKGIEFCLFKKAAILADEMGLGKTIQAISIAILKRKYFSFQRTLIICPSSVKYQWKNEIEKFTNEKAVVIDGPRSKRKYEYFSTEYFFYITNYETVIRDKSIINAVNFDFIILDEAQRIKNYETKTSQSITTLNKKHGLIITGTPIENKLVDLYSIVLFLDKYMITPLWEFSYKHCIFDTSSKNRINGYYNLQELRDNLKDLILRREKREVLKDLPSLTQQDIYIKLHQEQSYLHNGFASRLAMILSKPFKTPYDYDQIIRLLTNMRRVCNSTYLIDRVSNFSSKLGELEHILIDQLNIGNNNLKVIIFSEWLESLMLIENLLTHHKIGYTKLTGKVSAKNRNALITEFEKNPGCKVFLSTEAGGAGLNLQVADTLINFEIPWNPAKKNQRIGRIDRLGQRAKKLHVFNLICNDSIEMDISAGLLLKQSLFDSVLNESSDTEIVDFSKQGRAQFIKNLEEIILSKEKQYEEEILINDRMVNLEISSTDENEDEVVFSHPQADHEDERTTGSTPEHDIKEGDSVSGTEKYEKMEEVMNKGMAFLAGMFEMATGQQMESLEGNSIKVDKETGEITMKFKLKL